MDQVTKIIEPMFAEINRLEALDNVTFDGLDNIPAVNCIRKAERKLQLRFNAVLNKDLHSTIDRPSLGKVLVHASGHTYVIENNQAYFDGFNLMSFEAQIFTMNISALRDVNERKGFLRLVVPVNSNYWIHTLYTYAFKTENSAGGGLMILKFDEGDVHVLIAH